MPEALGRIILFELWRKLIMAFSLYYAEGCPFLRGQNPLQYMLLNIIDRC